MKVAFVTTDWGQLPTYGIAKPRRTPGGANYYRCTLPADTLNRYSTRIEARVYPDAFSRTHGELIPIDHQGNIETDWQPDIVVLQRWMRPEMAHAIHAARSTGQIVINDVDDDLWNVHKTNRFNDTISDRWNTDHYRRALAVSDHITVSTTQLADVIHHQGIPHHQISVLPNMIDLDLWTPQPVNDECRTIGWVGATDHRSGDLETVSDVIRHFTRDHRLSFLHGGHSANAPAARKLLRLSSATPSIVRPRQPIHRYATLWRDIDIAIIPLNNVPFNHCKSPIKAMEASAAGVPYVATDIAPYRAYGGLLAANDAQWRAQLESLIDPDVRRRIRDDGLRRIQAHTSATRWHDWDTLYRALVQDPPGVGASPRSPL